MRRIGPLTVDSMYKINMVIPKLLLIISSISLISSCSSTAQDEDVANEVKNFSSVGWLHGNCLSIKTDVDLNAYNLTFVSLDDKQEVTNLKLGDKANTGEACYALLEDRAVINMGDNRRFYIVESNFPIDLGIGIISASSKAIDVNEVLDLDSDGAKDTFSYCSTSEGMQFSVWSGEAYKSKLLWSDYYYLGYDTEANCPNVVFGE